MTNHERPQEIIEHCLKPLGLNEHSPHTQEAVRRLVDVFQSLQLSSGSNSAPPPDLSAMRAVVINESAHGYEG